MNHARMVDSWITGNEEDGSWGDFVFSEEDIPHERGHLQKGLVPPDSTHTFALVDEHEALADQFRGIIDQPDDGHADVRFEVGGRHLGGLRAVLGLRCPVLQRMLSGNFQEAHKSAPVKLPQFDNCPNAFREFLYFLHTGLANLHSPASAIHLYEVAKFFCSDSLADRCIQCLQEAPLNAEDALLLVKFALRHDMPALLSAAWQLIGRDADSALLGTDAAEVVASLPRDLLRMLFESEESSISEGTLLRILLAMEEEGQKEMTPFIRLPLLPPADMMQIVVPSKLFDLEQCVAAMAFQSDPNSVQLPAAWVRRRTFRCKAGSQRCGQSRLFEASNDDGSENSLVCPAGRSSGRCWCSALIARLEAAAGQTKMAEDKSLIEEVDDDTEETSPA